MPGQNVWQRPLTWQNCYHLNRVFMFSTSKTGKDSHGTDLIAGGSKQKKRLRKNTLTCFLILLLTISRQKVFQILRGACRKNSKFPATKRLLKTRDTTENLNRACGRRSITANHVRKADFRHKKTTFRWFHDTAYCFDYSSFSHGSRSGT